MRDTNLEHDVATVFAVDVAEHRMIVALDQGLHRHLIFERREHSWNCRFELITVPGSLTITGDHGSYTFRRLRDMFQFFRSNPDRPHRINIDYWAEKLPDAGRSVKAYSEQAVRIRLAEMLQDAVDESHALQRGFDEEYAHELNDWLDEMGEIHEGGAQDGPDAMAMEFAPMPEAPADEDWPELVEARQKVATALEILEDYPDMGDLGWEEEARDLFGRLERAGLVSDTWEWDLTDWDFHFVWCLHAIAWGIQQYDLAVRSGLHKIRTGPMPWDTPLPTAAPTRPLRERAEKPTPIQAIITLREAERPGKLETVKVAEGLL